MDSDQSFRNSLLMRAEAAPRSLIVTLKMPAKLKSTIVNNMRPSCIVTLKMPDQFRESLLKNKRPSLIVVLKAPVQPNPRTFANNKGQATQLPLQVPVVSDTMPTDPVTEVQPPSAFGLAGGSSNVERPTGQSTSAPTNNILPTTSSPGIEVMELLTEQILELGQTHGYVAQAMLETMEGFTTPQTSDQEKNLKSSDAINVEDYKARLTSHVETTARLLTELELAVSRME